MDKNDLIVLSDENLLMQTAAGDLYAEEVLIERYLPVVNGIARKYYLAGGEKDDLIQEGLMGLLSAIREFNMESDRGTFERYASVCIEHRLYSAIRTANREKHSALNGAVPLEEVESLQNQRDLSRTTENALIEQEAISEYDEKINTLLSVYERNVLQLYLSGESYLKISQNLGKTEKSVDNAVQRIRKKLRNLFY